MRRNFKITALVEFNGSFGVLDVHNAYDMATVSHDPISRALTLTFVANRHVLSNKPASFQLCVTGLTSLEFNVTPDIPYDFHVEDITFREPSNRDYDVYYDEHFDDDVAEGRDMVFKLGGNSYMRIAADEARVVVAV